MYTIYDALLVACLDPLACEWGKHNRAVAHQVEVGTHHCVLLHAVQHSMSSQCIALSLHIQVCIRNESDWNTTYTVILIIDRRMESILYIQKKHIVRKKIPMSIPMVDYARR